MYVRHACRSDSVGYTNALHAYFLPEEESELCAWSLTCIDFTYSQIRMQL